MANRSLNKTMLIGNLTRDPELRYTPGGVAVCSFGLATNRRWTTQSGEKKEDAQFHRIVAWSQLAELCSQLLTKGRRVYLEGRLQYREWTGQDGNRRRDAEIVISDMIILDSRYGGQESGLEEELEKTVSPSGPEEEEADSKEAAPTTEDELIIEPIEEEPGKEEEEKEKKETEKKIKKSKKEEKPF